METQRKKRKKRGVRLSRAQIMLCCALVLVLMGGSFTLGWHFGAQPSKFEGNILLVNDEHLLSENYVPEGLVNLYEQRHSFRLASSTYASPPLTKGVQSLQSRPVGM